MHTRSFTAIAFLLLCSFALSYSQECQDCKRRIVILYDNEVNVQRPFTNRDSLTQYWSYFLIAGGVKDYIANTDATRDCILRQDGAFFTTKDTATNSLKYGIEHANLPPAGDAAGVTDYILHGTISNDHPPLLTLKLEAGKTRELVKSGSATLPYGFDPFAVGKTVAASIGPIYTSIMQFERKKRDEGEPYAINPKITFIPGKAKLNVNEKTNVDVLFKDCDGAPLKGRHLTLQADGGTLKNAVVTTDDQGKATVEFTAGPQSAIATITSTYPYQKPTGYMDAAEVEDGVIQIKKPNDSWYITAEFEITNDKRDEEKNSIGTVSSSASHDQTHIGFSAWLKNISPLSDQFIMNPQSYTVKYWANAGENSHSHSHYENPLGFIDDNSSYQSAATAIPTAVPTLDVNIAPDSYSLGIDGIDAAQNGGRKSIHVTSDPFSGMRTTTDETTAEPSTTLGLWQGAESNDTTYSTSEQSTVGYVRTIKNTHVVQTFFWKNQTARMVYKQDYNETTLVDTPGLYQSSRWDQSYTIVMYLSYTGDPPTAVEGVKQTAPTTYSLNQNYPNPFNPSTIISYVLPQRAQTTLTITDILGRKIITLVDGEQAAGIHTMKWNAVGLPSGVYFLQMRAGGFVQTKKLLLAK